MLTDYFDTIEEKLNYKRWFFGHYHMDREVDEKHTLLYYDIIPLEDSGEADVVPVLGRPRFRLGEYVVFGSGKEEKQGKIMVVDAFGTFEQNEEPSYDVYVEEENCIYKHIMESAVRKAT